MLTKSRVKNGTPDNEKATSSSIMKIDGLKISPTSSSLVNQRKVRERRKIRRAAARKKLTRQQQCSPTNNDRTKISVVTSPSSPPTPKARKNKWDWEDIKLVTQTESTATVATVSTSASTATSASTPSILEKCAGLAAEYLYPVDTTIPDDEIIVTDISNSSESIMSHGGHKIYGMNPYASIESQNQLSSSGSGIIVANTSCNVDAIEVETKEENLSLDISSENLSGVIATEKDQQKHSNTKHAVAYSKDDPLCSHATYISPSLSYQSPCQPMLSAHVNQAKCVPDSSNSSDESHHDHTDIQLSEYSPMARMRHDAVKNFMQLSDTDDINKFLSRVSGKPTTITDKNRKQVKNKDSSDDTPENLLQDCDFLDFKKIMDLQKVLAVQQFSPTAQNLRKMIANGCAFTDNAVCDGYNSDDMSLPSHSTYSSRSYFGNKNSYATSEDSSIFYDFDDDDDESINSQNTYTRSHGAKYGGKVTVSRTKSDENTETYSVTDNDEVIGIRKIPNNKHSSNKLSSTAIVKQPMNVKSADVAVAQDGGHENNQHASSCMIEGTNETISKQEMIADADIIYTQHNDNSIQTNEKLVNGKITTNPLNNINNTFPRNTVKHKRKSKEVIPVRGENFAIEFLHELITKGIPLKLHKVQNLQYYMRPASVRIFVQQGKSEQGTFTEPKLLWDIDDRFNDENPTPKSQHVESRGSLNLFDVASVEKTGAMNLHSYPFAIPSNSFFVATYNGSETLFEATDKAEQQRIIDGFHHLMARIAFDLIAGNKEKCWELFDSVGALAEENVSSLSLEEIGDLCATKAMNDVTLRLVDKSVFRLNNLVLI